MILLMRSMQVSAHAHRVQFDHAAALVAYKAHVRSVLEYGSVIWSGAAVTHLGRLERLQHRIPDVARIQNSDLVSVTRLRVTVTEVRMRISEVPTDPG